MERMWIGQQPTYWNFRFSFSCFLSPSLFSFSRFYRSEHRMIVLFSSLFDVSQGFSIAEIPDTKIARLHQTVLNMLEEKDALQIQQRTRQEVLEEWQFSDQQRLEHCEECKFDWLLSPLFSDFNSLPSLPLSFFQSLIYLFEKIGLEAPCDGNDSGKHFSISSSSHSRFKIFWSDSCCSSSKGYTRSM